MSIDERNRRETARKKKTEDEFEGKMGREERDERWLEMNSEPAEPELK